MEKYDICFFFRKNLLAVSFWDKLLCLREKIYDSRLACKTGGKRSLPKRIIMVSPELTKSFVVEIPMGPVV